MGVTNESSGAFKELEIEEKEISFLGLEHKHKHYYDKTNFF